MKITSALLSTVLLAMTVAASPVHNLKRQDASDNSTDSDPFGLLDLDPVPLTAIPVTATATVVSLPTAAIVASITSQAAVDASSAIASASASAAAADPTPTDGSSAPSKRDAACWGTPFKKTVYTGTTPSSQYNALQADAGDTPDAFSAFQKFQSDATGATSPDGYTRMYTNENAASNSADWYSVTTLPSYDVGACAALCTTPTNPKNAGKCKGFNIYYERDPMYAHPYNDGCPVPPSMTVVKCVLHSYLVSDQSLGNPVQYRNGFKVVISGSNGYVASNNDVVPSIDGYQGTFFGNYVLNAPAKAQLPAPPAGEFTDGKDHRINTLWQTTTFNNGLTDITACGTWCKSSEAYNAAHPRADGTYNRCNFFTAAMVYKNRQFLGVACAAYSYDFSGLKSDASTHNFGQTRGGDTYSYDSVVGYTVDNFANTPAFRTEVPAGWF